jgi:hypothetical protein
LNIVSRDEGLKMVHGSGGGIRRFPSPSRA